MTGVVQRISGMGSDRSTNWATTTSVITTPLYFLCFIVPWQFVPLNNF